MKYLREEEARFERARFDCEVRARLMTRTEQETMKELQSLAFPRGTVRKAEKIPAEA